jgi:hypothetical protein
MYSICSQGPYRAVNSDRELATLFCFTGEILTIRRTLASTGYVHYFIFWGKAGLSDFVTSLGWSCTAPTPV